MGAACGCGDQTVTRTEEITHAAGDRQPREQNQTPGIKKNKHDVWEALESGNLSYKANTQEQRARLERLVIERHLV